MTARLAEADGPADDGLQWPDDLWRLIEEAGATALVARGGIWRNWLPPASSGSAIRATRGRELTAVFILSQHDAGVRRLQAAPENDVGHSLAACHRPGTSVHDRGDLASHHLAPTGDTACEGRRDRTRGYRLDGTIPWVTAAARADVLVTGAVLDDGRQMLIALPADRPGVEVRPPFPLAALQASCTTEVVLADTDVDDCELLAGRPATFWRIRARSARPGWRPRHWPSAGAGGAFGSGRSFAGSDRPRRTAGSPLRKLASLLGPVDRPGTRRARCRFPRSDPHASQLAWSRSTQATSQRDAGPDFFVPSPPSGGRARPSFSWSGRVPRRSPRRRFATSRGCARCEGSCQFSGATSPSAWAPRMSVPSGEKASVFTT